MELYTIRIVIPSPSSNPEAKSSTKWMFCRSKQTQEMLVESLNSDFSQMPFAQPSAVAGHTVDVSAEVILDADLRRTTRWVRSGDAVVGVSCYNRPDGAMPIGFDF